MPTLDLQVGASGDDVLHRGSIDALIINDVAFAAGDNDTNPRQFGSAALFLNVTIPPGSTIDVAHLKLIARASRSGTVVRTNIQAEAVDDATQITSDTDWHTRGRTTALTPWDNIPAWTIEDSIQSPDFSPVIQEIIDRPNRPLNGAIQVFWLNDVSDAVASAFRSAYSWDGNTVKAPKLHIEYTDNHARRRRVVCPPR